MIAARSRAEIRFAEPQGVAPGGYYHAFRDDRDGTVVFDGDHRVTAAPIPAWRDLQGRHGFGIGPFGSGPFGIGEAAGPGFGNFPFGVGPFGVGGQLVSIRTPKLADGTWTFTVVSYDAAGNATTPPAAEASVALAGTPRPPTNAAAEDDSGDVKLTWTLSADDDGA